MNDSGSDYSGHSDTWDDATSSSRGSRTKDPAREPGSRIYPFTRACYVPMQDVLEDGPVPDQRVGAQTLHLDLFFTVVRVANLPKVDMQGKCDCFAEVVFKEYDLMSLKPNIVTHKTGIEKNTFEPEFNEQFQFFVHHIQARESMRKSGANAAVVNLYDWDRFKAKDLIGRVSFDLRDLLQLPQGMGEIISEVTDIKGKYVVGHTGEQTRLTVSVQLKPRYQGNATNMDLYGNEEAGWQGQGAPLNVGARTPTPATLARRASSSSQGARGPRRSSVSDVLMATVGFKSPPVLSEKERKGLNLIERARYDPGSGDPVAV
eukprot:CAMPEP_0206242774 /NCGR_PEP_ID=MMETSP0047_2-20121206/17238_1 /ASSEMBLY_ACC=CAM_ASM_000192 /TAXON_ID=195065 /ORGANISM="Chroomonas mesostigmatica_cf, Strain CCMP1168" /LENGTH=317 /DNA_ID=CAMNT_0053667819 /DNA_START=70 /DNA_END=1019 /DNA_ORIENTATION=-